MLILCIYLPTYVLLGIIIIVIIFEAIKYLEVENKFRWITKLKGWNTKKSRKKFFNNVALVILIFKIHVQAFFFFHFQTALSLYFHLQSYFLKQVYIFSFSLYSTLVCNLSEYYKKNNVNHSRRKRSFFFSF